MQLILILGDHTLTLPMAQELTAAGYQVDTRPLVELAESGVPADVTAVVAVPANVRELDGVAKAAGSGVDKKPVLAVLPEELFASGTADLPAGDFAYLPLRPRELEVRLRRLLDRHALPESSDLLRRGALAMDGASYRVFVDNEPVELTFKEYELLRFLAVHPDRVYTREALLDKVWGYDYFGGARTVDVHIRRIRSKIERGHVFIETVRSVGYRFRASP
jgi:DNA-binding response OmpR family regulator